METIAFVFKCAFGIFESWWRRWFGGGYIGGKDKENTWYNIRAMQHAVGALIMFLSIWLLVGIDKLAFLNWILPTWVAENISWIGAIYVTAIMQGLFWARAHGPGFDIGRDGNPNPTLIKRYEKEWWNKICQYLVPKKEWYGYGYDMLWMRLRYTACTVLLTPIFGFDILFMGLIVPFIYSMCWSLSENKPGFAKKFPSWMQVNGPTSFAEWIVGLSTGLFLMFCY